MPHRPRRPASQDTTFIDLVMSTVGMFLWIALFLAAFIICSRDQAQAATIFSQAAIDSGGIELTIVAALALGLLLGGALVWAVSGPRRIVVHHDPYAQAFGDLPSVPPDDDLQRRIDRLRARELEVSLSGGGLVRS